MRCEQCGETPAACFEGHAVLCEACAGAIRAEAKKPPAPAPGSPSGLFATIWLSNSGGDTCAQCGARLPDLFLWDQTNARPFCAVQCCKDWRGITPAEHFATLD